MKVLYRDRLIGRLWLNESSEFAFQYAADWLEESDRFPLSLSLPLGAQIQARGPTRAFFQNLLPEGGIRQAICQRLGISIANDFALLTAIGGDCAGALSIAASRAESLDPAYRPLPEKEFSQWLAAWPVYSSAAALGGVRLSMAGAQDKLPVYLNGDSLFIPLGDAPSSHLLKLPSRDFAHLPANEFLLNQLAASAGLPVVEASLMKVETAEICQVTRYDRRVVADEGLVRIHQEDLCQALGIRADMKYESEGGPSFKACLDLVTRHCTDPMPATAALVDWLLFNLLTGNADGHAKNLALIHETRDRLSLAPFYDLVCTRAYDRLDRRLAMSIGGNFDPGTIGPKDFEGLAKDIQVGHRYLMGRVRSLAANLSKTLDEIGQTLQHDAGEHPILQMVAPQIRKQIRRTLQLLDS